MPVPKAASVVKMRRFFLVTVVFLALLPGAFASEQEPVAAAPPGMVPLRAEDFRDDVIRFVRATANHLVLGLAAPAAGLLDQRWSTPYRYKQWGLTVTAYRGGQVVGSGAASELTIAPALQRATERALTALATAGDGASVLEQIRFLVSFNYLPDGHYDVLEYQGRGLQWQGERTIVSQIDAASLNAQIEASKRYLLRMQNPARHAWFRLYEALDDHEGSSLRTIYTASSLLSLIKLNKLHPDAAIQRIIAPTGAFLHSMQLRQGPQAGALFYAMNPETGDTGCRLMAGTASKTIFTWLQMHREGLDEEALPAARRAGDWLLQLVQNDGQVWPKVMCDGDGWKVSREQSFLYSGQVLAALSRLYAVTGDQRYYAAATRIADRTVAQLDAQNGFVGDDYRVPNSISTSWVAQSLNDYAEINPDARYRDAIERAMTQVLWRQIQDRGNRFDHGRFLDTMSSSGNGWINEVLGVLYPSCVERGRANCQRYLDAMVASSRWLLQNSYNAQNSVLLPNPGRAEGGMIGSIRRYSVRTDAVGHALNGLLSLAIAKAEDPGPWLQLPERRFDEVLILLRSRDEAVLPPGASGRPAK
jgi:hypothetical protein